MSNSRVELEATRFHHLDRTLSTADGVTGVSHTEDYIPPHKMAGFVPYDALIALESVDWTVDDVEDLLDAHDLDYDRVINVGRNDSRHGGPALAFVSLVDHAD